MSKYIYTFMIVQQETKQCHFKNSHCDGTNLRGLFVGDHIDNTAMAENHTTLGELPISGQMLPAFSGCHTAYRIPVP